MKYPTGVALTVAVDVFDVVSSAELSVYTCPVYPTAVATFSLKNGAVEMSSVRMDTFANVAVVFPEFVQTHGV